MEKFEQTAEGDERTGHLELWGKEVQAKENGSRNAQDESLLDIFDKRRKDRELKQSKHVGKAEGAKECVALKVSVRTWTFTLEIKAIEK